MAQTLPKSAPGFFPALLLTAILMAFLAAAAAPTPLYALYRESWQFSPALLTLAFSIYAGGLMLALLVFGSLSDYLGRRPLIRAALIIELLAMSVFLYANSVELLIAARLLQGFATGIATAVLGAAMLDIDRERGPLINSVAPMLGMALGALGSSALVQFGSDPLHRVYVWLLAVFALALVLLRWLPESVSRQPGALASLKPRIRIPPQARRAFWSVAPLNASLWALGGFYLSLGPTLARQVTGLQVPMIGGGLVSLLCFCGAVAIFALRNRPAAVILRRGGLALIIGLLITLLGVDSSNLWLFFIGTAVAGLGFGGAFLGALRSVVPLAHAHERGALMASFYVLSYLAFSVPAILAGLAIQRYGLVATTNGYASLQILAASLVLLLSLRTPAAQKAPA
ncbi:MFS transporter [Pseudomonas nitroreducens]|uniref:MFS transporter n=1 Tax=Pseudomonas nitroreducens TaxID=46680 RepID=UPI00265922C4|nr:MFS transporter [Pseudomonas nitroreducens]MCP1651196.1 MFS family permease [Pseudomonas nitroreducens]MCP1684279.1 MFS family permease [Pseudomonas nitroreducens]